MLALPKHRPAVVWMFITAIFLPLGPSNSTMSAPLWMALHSNHACLEKEKLSLLPCQPMTSQEKTMETTRSTRKHLPSPASRFFLLMRMHLGGERHRMLKAQSGQILWNWLVPDTMYGNMGLTKIVVKYCSVYF
jgi:hypothetical protein